MSVKTGQHQNERQTIEETWREDSNSGLSEHQRLPSEPKPMPFFSSRFLSWSVQAAIANHQRWGISQQLLFSQFWKLGLQGAKVQTWPFMGKTAYCFATGSLCGREVSRHPSAFTLRSTDSPMRIPAHDFI